MYQSVDLQYWNSLAKLEAEENQKRKFQHGRGICTVFLLDTSGSMAGDGFRQMQEAFMEILNEISAHPDTDENVAVISFGREVKFLHYYSNNYGSVIQCLADVECSGSSPMEAGILLALSCLLYGGGHTAVFDHNITVCARFIIISDGWPSTSADIGGPEIDKKSKEPFYDGTIAGIEALIKTIGRTNPIVCIPVGSDPNAVFFENLMHLSRRGRLINHRDARQCGRFGLHIKLTDLILDQRAADQIKRKDIERIVRFTRIRTDFTKQDLEDIFTIINSLDLYKPITAEDLEDDEYTERYPNVPKIGTRVKRGLHWTYKNQDSNRPGTVVGHSERYGWVIVEWDNGVKLDYQYGFDGMIEKYDIASCKEPRILENELIAVGCLVSRGPDWKWGDQDGGEGNIGTVYRVKQEAVVYVKWPNGNRCNYRYGYKNNDPFEASYHSNRRLNHSEPQTSSRGTRGRELKSHSTSNGVDQSQSHRYTECSSKNIELDEASKCETSYECNENSSCKQAWDRRWQWKDSSGSWNDYSDEINDKIEDCYRRKPESSVVINLKGHLCRIIFVKRIQIDTISKSITDIRSSWDD
ncbi:uncharacterized protein LOC134281126 isoform X2 [Saccostrea cucullata]|uniref:uncharacterized protein LOC134281126 isoform X2 n=1 Tax=Saccostrea cuccullata TaxID=36930 RepID=UPI002ED5B057